jgi:hypothetical protein
MLEFYIVITGHHALPFVDQCVDSIQAQLGSFFVSTLYVDDASNYSEEEKYRLQHCLDRVRGKVLFLSERHYQIGALAMALPTIASEQGIVCLVDGDDYLLPHALKTIAAAYANREIAFTYGNVLVDFRPYQDTQADYFFDKKTVNTPYPREVWQTRTFRSDGYRCFHLKTFRRWLWDSIDPKDFLRASGKWIQASGDSAYTFPILELLADPKHVAFIEQPLYVYRLHSGNIHCSDKKSQTDDLNYLRFHKERYPPLDRAVLNYYLKGDLCVG